MANCLDVAFVVIEIDPKYGVGGPSVCEIVGFKHVDQKVNGRSTSLNFVEHRIQRETIAVKYLLDIMRSFRLQIVDQENKPVFGREELPGWETNLLGVSVGDLLAAAEHPEPASFRPDWRTLTDSPNHPELACSCCCNRPKKLRQECFFTVSGNDESEVKESPFPTTVRIGETHSSLAAKALASCGATAPDMYSEPAA